ncbi:MAG: hypothetical protein K2X66_04285 [Cyanobacteria bacterium]|nr:hypothetical protein [Cyanobacteriota bacterium]
MNAFVISFTFRTLDNFLPVLEHIDQTGGKVFLLLYPHLGDPNHVKLSAIPYPRLIERPISNLIPENGLTVTQLKEDLQNALTQYQETENTSPDVILIDDLYNFPSNQVKPALVQLGYPQLPVIAFQHGMDQPWGYYNEKFNCDYFFCFSPEFLRFFKRALHPKIIPVGLPKLDRLREVSVSEAPMPYLLFIAETEPKWEELQGCFHELIETLQVSILIKPHPQFPERYTPLLNHRIHLIQSDYNIVPFIAHASYVISCGSTSSLEVLWLSKKLAILPTFTSKYYDHRLFVTRDFTASEVIRVFKQQEKNPQGVEKFFKAHTGGRGYQSTLASIHALHLILEAKKIK